MRGSRCSREDKAPLILVILRAAQNVIWERDEGNLEEQHICGKITEGGLAMARYLLGKDSIDPPIRRGGTGKKKKITCFSIYERRVAARCRRRGLKRPFRAGRKGLLQWALEGEGASRRGRCPEEKEKVSRVAVLPRRSPLYVILTGPVRSGEKVRRGEIYLGGPVTEGTKVIVFQTTRMTVKVSGVQGYVCSTTGQQFKNGEDEEKRPSHEGFLSIKEGET